MVFPDSGSFRHIRAGEIQDVHQGTVYVPVGAVDFFVMEHHGGRAAAVQVVSVDDAFLGDNQIRELFHRHAGGPGIIRPLTADAQVFQRPHLGDTHALGLVVRGVVEIVPAPSDFDEQMDLLVDSMIITESTDSASASPSMSDESRGDFQSTTPDAQLL